MITKEHLSNAMQRDCDIALHLFDKLKPDAMDYRPSRGQRSTTELLRYLSVCGIAGLRSIAEADFKIFGEYLAGTESMAPQQFPETMKRQKQAIADFFERTSEDSLERQEASLPGGGKMPLGVAIMNGPLKWLNSYKFQLFLYAKATSAPDIGTANVWGGRDMPAPPPS